MLPEASVIHAARLARSPERLAAATRLQLDAGAAIPAVAHIRARQFRTRFIACCAAAFEAFDVLLSPTAPSEAPAEDPPIEEGGGSDEMLFTAPANLAGLPALSLPCGRSAAGLPFGLHLTAARGQDARLLDIAEAIEAVLAAP
jgi:aspartyl-tRNA(Asn)/glutamyl-tRNA(Gln) amidotransferase subunit A